MVSFCHCIIFSPSRLGEGDRDKMKFLILAVQFPRRFCPSPLKQLLAILTELLLDSAFILIAAAMQTKTLPSSSLHGGGGCCFWFCVSSWPSEPCLPLSVLGVRALLQCFSVPKLHVVEKQSPRHILWRPLLCFIVLIPLEAKLCIHFTCSPIFVLSTKAFFFFVHLNREWL